MFVYCSFSFYSIMQSYRGACSSAGLSLSYRFQLRSARSINKGKKMDLLERNVHTYHA